MLSCLRVPSQVADAPDGSDEIAFSLMFPQRDLQARGIAVLDHTHLQQPDSKQSVDLGVTEGCQG